MCDEGTTRERRFLPPVESLDLDAIEAELTRLTDAREAFNGALGRRLDAIQARVAEIKRAEGQG